MKLAFLLSLLLFPFSQELNVEIELRDYLTSGEKNYSIKFDGVDPPSPCITLLDMETSFVEGFWTDTCLIAYKLPNCVDVYNLIDPGSELSGVEITSFRKCADDRSKKVGLTLKNNRRAKLKEFKDLCGCENLSNAISYQAVKTSFNFNCFSAYSEQNCEGNRITFDSEFAYKMLQDPESYEQAQFKIKSVSACGIDCLKLNSKIIKFVVDPDVDQSSYLKSVKLAATSEIDNDAMSRISKTIENSKTIRQRYSVSYSSSISGMYSFSLDKDVRTEFGDSSQLMRQNSTNSDNSTGTNLSSSSASDINKSVGGGTHSQAGTDESSDIGQHVTDNKGSSSDSSYGTQDSSAHTRERGSDTSIGAGLNAGVGFGPISVGGSINAQHTQRQSNSNTRSNTRHKTNSNSIHASTSNMNSINRRLSKSGQFGSNSNYHTSGSLSTSNTGGISRNQGTSNSISNAITNSLSSSISQALREAYSGSESRESSNSSSYEYEEAETFTFRATYDLPPCTKTSITLTMSILDDIPIPYWIYIEVTATRGQYKVLGLDFLEYVDAEDVEFVQFLDDYTAIFRQKQFIRANVGLKTDVVARGEELVDCKRRFNMPCGEQFNA